MTETTAAVAATQTTDLTTLFGEQNTQLPAHLADNDEDAGLGNENVSVEDQQIPRLSLLQKLSPQLDSVEGAQAGMFHNSVTDELYPEVYLINLAYKKEYTIWRKRNKGGGYCGAYDTNEAALAQIDTLPGNTEDYDVEETAKHACLVINPETGEIAQPIVVYMKSSALQASRNWNSQIATFNGNNPRFSSIWHLTSIQQSNENGSWFSWKINKGAWVPNEAMYNTAKDFYNTISHSF